MIDHAPLFPPASLPLDAALAEHRRARGSADGWLVARFVCPASRLDDLARAYEGETLPLAVLLDGRWGDTGALAALDGRFRVEAVECRLPPGADASDLDGAAPHVYLELAPDDTLPARLDEVAARGMRAKVRCGGDRVPTVAELARAVRLCRERGVAFKATAGLHRAVRAGAQHGFLNLLAAAVFGDEERALAEDAADAFSCTRERFAWRARGAGAEEVARARRALFAGYGSCSAGEPVADLRALGFLPA